MIAANWKKVLADLWKNKTRSALVAMSIAVGVFAVGVVISSFFITRQDMSADYLGVNPHTARIYTDSFDDTLVAELANVAGVTAIEGRTDLAVNIADDGGKLHQVTIDMVAPLAQIKVDQLVYVDGARQIGAGEIALERQGAAGLSLKPGDRVDVILKGGQVVSLILAGTVHDVNANPYNFTGKTSGYVNPETMATLKGSSQYSFVTLVSDGSHTDAAHVRAVAEDVAASIRASGREVYNINVNRPGQHPAQSIIDTVLMLMGILGVLAVFLSGFLVTNTVSALMSQQTRQIGVMKAVGASTGQIIGMYLVLMLGFGLIGLLIALPFAALVSYGLTHWLIGMLNATPSPFTLPLGSLAVQLAIGLLVPVLAGLLPVISGARLTVREAINSYGTSLNTGQDIFDRALNALHGLPRPLALSLRNTFRRKMRLVLTLSVLVLGGAIFMAVFSVRESMYSEFDQMYGYYQADLNADFPEFYPLDRLQAAVDQVPGVAWVEGWGMYLTNILRSDGQSDDLVAVIAPPAETRLVKPVVTEGRWLQPGDNRAIVLDNHFMKLRPDVQVGDTLQMRFNKQDYDFTVVGIFRIAGDPPNPLVYVNQETMAEISHMPGQVNALRIVTDSHDAARQNTIVSALQARFQEGGIEATLLSGSDSVSQKRSQTDMLTYLLMFMAVLIAAVGGLGLTGTMGMNVLERTREIGVMRAIGAQNGSIFQMVVVEGMLVGVISWGLSIVVAYPIAQMLDNRLGVSLLTVPLAYQPSLIGLALWLGIVLVLSAVASFLPARNAVRLTVRDVLAYE